MLRVSMFLPTLLLLLFTSNVFINLSEYYSFKDSEFYIFRNLYFSGISESLDLQSILLKYKIDCIICIFDSIIDFNDMVC